MDPITASTTLATIVGLICNYKQECGAKKDLDHRDFIEWLEYHRHEDIKNLITNTHGLQEEVNKLLREDHAEILKKLDSINDVLSQVLSRVSGFELLTQQFGHAAELSEQALSILHQFADSNATELRCVQLAGGSRVFIAFGSDVKIAIKDQRFLCDDLRTLELLGFIRVSLSSEQGEVLYSLTRAGANYAKISQLDKLGV
jgi:hypothetical protein